MQTLLENPHILIVLKQKNIHYFSHEILKDREVVGIKVCDALNEECRLLSRFAPQLLVYELAESINAISAVRLHLEGSCRESSY